jgi:hypothetical protein
MLGRSSDSRHCFALDRLEQQMRVVRTEFSRGERTYYSQEDQDAVHRLLLTYLNLRTALLRTVWTYRSGLGQAIISGE